MFTWLSERRRRRLRENPLPADAAHAFQDLPYVKLLPPAERERLMNHVKIFIGEKHFEGCGGFQMTDEARITIAVHACLLIMNRNTGYYPGLTSVLVYPEVFVAEREEEDEDGIVIVDDEPYAGESWDRGVVVLAWGEIRESLRAWDGYNVILHEFAHQLDDEDGLVDGAPPLFRNALRETWGPVFQKAYEDLVRDVRRRRRTLLDDYGAESPAEFFAVATETFFELPWRMHRSHPDLYELLMEYYRQDPKSYFPLTASAR